VLNLAGLGVGAVIAPRRILRAWARGRRTRNLYTERRGIDHLLPRTVAEMRGALGLDRPHPAVRVRDALAVAAVSIPMLGVLVAFAAAPVIAATLVVAAITWRRKHGSASHNQQSHHKQHIHHQ